MSDGASASAVSRSPAGGTGISEPNQKDRMVADAADQYSKTLEIEPVRVLGIEYSKSLEIKPVRALEIT